MPPKHLPGQNHNQNHGYHCKNVAKCSFQWRHDNINPFIIDPLHWTTTSPQHQNKQSFWKCDVIEVSMASWRHYPSSTSAHAAGQVQAIAETFPGYCEGIEVNAGLLRRRCSDLHPTKTVPRKFWTYSKLMPPPLYVLFPSHWDKNLVRRHYYLQHVHKTCTNADFHIITCLSSNPFINVCMNLLLALTTKIYIYNHLCALTRIHNYPTLYISHTY